MPVSSVPACAHVRVDIALCGDYAGNSALFAQTCKGVCYQDYVLGDGSAYNDAYFAVNYVNVFGTSNATVIPGGAPRANAVSALTAGLVTLAAAAWLVSA
jgi:hypothetical protein